MVNICYLSLLITVIQDKVYRFQGIEYNECVFYDENGDGEYEPYIDDIFCYTAEGEGRACQWA